MGFSIPFSKGDIESLVLFDKLRNALLLTYDVGDDLPKTVTIDDNEYVIDEDEVSVVWKDEPDTTCAIYVRPDRTTWRKWADADGTDSVTLDLTYEDGAGRDLAELVNFYERVTD